MQSDVERENSSAPKPVGKGSHPGTVPVLYEKIIAARQAKGWSSRTLAKRAGCSLVTVKSIESGHPAFPSSIEKVGKPLGLKLIELTEGLERIVDPVNQQETKKKAKFYISFDASYSKFDESNVAILIKEIRDRHNIQGEITVLYIEEGSVVVILEMDEDDAVKLFEILSKEEIPGFQINQIGITATGTGYASETSYERIFLAIDNSRFKYQSYDLAGFKILSNKFLLLNHITFYISIFIYKILGKQLSRYLGYPLTSIYYYIHNIPNVFKNINAIIAAFTPVIMADYYGRRLELAMETRDGRVPFDWGLVLRLAAVIFPNILNLVYIRQIKDDLIRYVSIASFVVNVIFFIVYYFF